MFPDADVFVEQVSSPTARLQLGFKFRVVDTVTGFWCTEYAARWIA